MEDKPQKENIKDKSFKKMIIISLCFHLLVFLLVIGIGGTSKAKTIIIAPPHIKGYLVNNPIKSNYGVKKRDNALPAPIVDIQTEESIEKGYRLKKSKEDEKKKALEKIKDKMKKKDKEEDRKKKTKAIKSIEEELKKMPRADNFALKKEKKNNGQLPSGSAKGVAPDEAINDEFTKYSHTIYLAVKSNFIPVNIKEIKANPNIIIEIGVELDKSGKLISLSVVKSSGLSSLDRSCINAIKISAPFEEPSEAIKSVIEERMFILTFPARDIIEQLE